MTLMRCPDCICYIKIKKYHKNVEKAMIFPSKFVELLFICRQAWLISWRSIAEKRGITAFPCQSIASRRGC